MNRVFRLVRAGLVLGPLVVTLTMCSSDDDGKADVGQSTSTSSSSSSSTASTVPPATADAAQVAKAAQITKSITEEKWAEVRAEFNEQMAAEVSEQRMAVVWEEAKANGGGLLGIGDPVFAFRDRTNIAYDTALDFERTDAKTQIAFDQDNKVSGLFILSV